METTPTPTKPRNLGSSLPVPNVQALAAHPDDLSPPLLRRYLRPVPAAAAAAAAATDDDVVPVIDLGKLLDAGVAGEDEAARLRLACEDWGFFQVVNHGIPEETVEAAKRDVVAFFHLPLAEKAAFAQVAGGVEGYGQAFVVSDEQTLDWADMYFLATQPPSYRDLRFWPPPSSSSTFARSMDRYSGEAQRVAGELLRAMARNLGVEDGEKLARLAAAQSMRMNYYPPCPRAADRVLGLSPHSDAVGLTLLLQVGDVPGLQIRRPSGAWMPVDPIPGALVANVGDVVEVLTNGRYRSIEHRAVVSAEHERVSIAAFHSGTFASEGYAPLEEVVGDGEEARYRSISVEEYVKLVFSSKLDGKNIMDAMKM